MVVCWRGNGVVVFCEILQGFQGKMWAMAKYKVAKVTIAELVKVAYGLCEWSHGVVVMRYSLPEGISKKQLYEFGKVV